jgi:hypothetical protein
MIIFSKEILHKSFKIPLNKRSPHGGSLSFGYVVLPFRCICSRYLKCIFNIFENAKKVNKILCVISVSDVPTKWF